MTRLKALLICAMLAVCGLAAESRAAALIVVGGELQGATGVNVNGTLYSVEFQDGTCVALFTGCDNAADDFAFTTASSAGAAAQALLDQVFLDVIGTGSFDSVPALTRGCTHTILCYAMVPYAFENSFFVAVQRALNRPDDADAVSEGNFSISSIDSSTVDTRTWAVFTVEVPEPATMALFGVGVAGVAFARRRRAGGKPRHG